MEVMDIKRVCRLCCSKDDVKHNLFTPNEGGVRLAEELSILTDIEITKEDNISECICVNCYKVNSFFKEFRKNCSEVNNYLKKVRTSEKSLPGDITIKEERLDDYEDQLASPLRTQEEETSRNPNMPYPVALVQSIQHSDELNQIRSNFLATKKSREEAGPSLTPENQNECIGTPNRRAEKRKNGDTNDSVKRRRTRVDIPTEEDLLNHVVKQEEVDIDDSPVENEIVNDEGSSNEPWSPPDSHHSLDSGSAGRHSTPDDDYCSSMSSCSSDDSDDDEDDSDMLMLLALLL